MHSSELWERSLNIFLWYLQVLVTTGYKTKKITKFTVFVRSGGEGGVGGSGGVLNASFERLRWGMGLPKLNKCEQEGRRVQILGIL